MTKIDRNIRILKSIVIIMIVLMLGGQFWYWFAPFSSDFVETSHPIISQYGGLESLDPQQSALGFLITLAPKLALVWAMILLLKLSNALIAGKWFDQDSENHCTQIGRWLIIFVGLTILHRTLLVLLLTMNNPEGEHHFSVSVSTNDLMTLVPALLCLIIGHMVRIARSQRDELNEIV